MKQHVKLVGQAKAVIDRGFSRVGRTLDPKDPAQKVLMGLAGRAISLANAVAHLCLNNHANEALPLLRTLLGISLVMRAVAEKGSEAALEHLREQAHPSWDSLFGTGSLKKWVRGGDFPDTLLKALSSSAEDYFRANAAGLPWSHVFAENCHAGRTSEDVLKMTAEVMGHVVSALNRRWDKFPGAEEIWKSLALEGGNSHESRS